jgi:hypothetical protein
MATDLKDRLAHAVHTSAYSYCYACLAKRLGATDKDVRHAAQVVALRAGFELAHRACCSCGAVEVLLADHTFDRGIPRSA